jgi:dihydrofolate reductase
MEIALVVAAAENDVIGKTGSLLPWNLPSDLAHFRQVTAGRPIIMGRKTYDTIGRALPGRRNIIITHQSDLTIPGCQVVDSLEAAMAAAKIDGPGQVFVIGGGQIFEQALPLAKKIYLTRVHATPAGDTKFSFDTTGWSEVYREDHPADEKNQYPYSFINLVRV